ncbi:MAG: DUF2656 domain-containing protein [Mastigocoleus sp. MO_167.B18]|uniref:DUF2656 domain-containing protein n=1 Tax=Mastigocoleus sp. MO_188.B34 TaxID=3036635 RepID=UPI00262C6ABC|nr:DUF2656 domain-containing protein [Mastigocoleus sp. MO_188.B34]MDJ0698047.1 DUF2656 domain-containing protein [Mastigocoleus sp. MO_188.B34]MDJ0773960.1 DUF2656 domain-containing protein [Mastigocoleus sp. MO_167.B18]
MIGTQKGRMLLSHNFDILDEVVPQLSREEFVSTFVDGLKSYSDISCSGINNPHWMVEVLFDPHQRSPHEVGELCAEALGKKRQTQKKPNSAALSILALGGLKTTPPLSTSPTSLQPGEWGVDVVETVSAEHFLQEIDWEVKTASKPPERIFKVELEV